MNKWYEEYVSLAWRALSDIRLLYVLLLFLFIVVIFFLEITTLTSILRAKVSTLDVAMLNPESIEQLVNSNPGQAESVLSSLKSFLSYILVGAMLVLVITLFSCAFLFSYFWSLLCRMSFRFVRFWKWLGVLPLMVLISLPVLLIMVLVQLIGGVLFSLFPVTVTEQLNTILLFASLLVFILLTVHFLYEFTKTYKIWSSFAHSWSALAERSFWKTYLVALIGAVVLNLVLLPFSYFWGMHVWYDYLSGVIFAIFIAWVHVVALNANVTKS